MTDFSSRVDTLWRCMVSQLGDTSRTKADDQLSHDDVVQVSEQLARELSDVPAELRTARVINPLLEKLRQSDLFDDPQKARLAYALNESFQRSVDKQTSFEEALKPRTEQRVGLGFIEVGGALYVGRGSARRKVAPREAVPVLREYENTVSPLDRARSLFAEYLFSQLADRDVGELQRLTNEEREQTASVIDKLLEGFETASEMAALRDILLQELDSYKSKLQEKPYWQETVKRIGELKAHVENAFQAAISKASR